MSRHTFSSKTLFVAAGAVLLGAGVVASANKTAKSTASKTPVPHNVKVRAKPVAAKRTAVKPATVKSAAVKPAAAPAGSAGWVYRVPGSTEWPTAIVPRGGVAPRGLPVKDPKDGEHVLLPPLTRSVATVGANGKILQDCEIETGAKTTAHKGAAHHGHKHK